MEREDPLERLERKELEKKSNAGLKAATIAMAAVAIALAAVLIYILRSKNALVSELNEEKQDLTEQIMALQSDYEGLSSEYDIINAQLDSSREEIAQLVERVKKTEATNRAKIRQYEKELGTLRSIMKNYIVQIDSLNTLNKKLTADAAAARRDAAESKNRSEELSRTVDQLSEQVATGSILKARGLSIAAYNSSGKQTDRRTRVSQFQVRLSLVENDLAPKGPVRVYIRVKDPEGVLIAGQDQRSFEFNGETLVSSASREIDYQGTETDVVIFVNGVSDCVKGIYSVEAYTDNNALGTAETMLR